MTRFLDDVSAQRVRSEIKLAREGVKQSLVEFPGSSDESKCAVMSLLRWLVRRNLKYIADKCTRKQIPLRCLKVKLSRQNGAQYFVDVRDNSVVISVNEWRDFDNHLVRLKYLEMISSKK